MSSLDTMTSSLDVELKFYQLTVGRISVCVAKQRTFSKTLKLNKDVVINFNVYKIHIGSSTLCIGTKLGDTR